jgi:choice-of-anchor A domain-containing protein
MVRWRAARFESDEAGWSRRALLCLALLTLASVPAGRASASVVDLGSAADYGILTGQKERLTFSGNLNLAGDLGVGSTSTLKFTGSHNAISGTEYRDSGVSSSGSASISGGVVTQSMSSAINDAVTAANTAARLAATPGLLDQGGSIDVNGGSIVIKAVQNASENVLNISSLSLTNGTITFDDNGYTDAKFIINVTGGFTAGKGAVIKGINSVDASDIIFNIEGTGSTVNLTGNSSTSVIGTILAPQRNISLGGGGSLAGALIAGVNNAGKSYTLNQSSSGYNITGFAYKPSMGGGGGHVPEPSSLALYGSGIAALIWFGRRLRA